MMKFLAVGLAAMLAMSAGVSAQTAGSVDSPNTPTTEGSQSVQTACILQTLSFSNGFQLVGDFKYNTFNYQCSCAGMTSTSTTATLGFGSADSSGEVTVNDVKLNFRTMSNAISRAGNVANSPRAGTSSPIVIKDNYANKIVIGVGCNGKGTPTTCYYQYTIKCTKGKPGYVVGDPQFVGLRGQSYQIHGVSNHIYNIVSDKDLQYNSRFVFLNSGKCPVVDGKKQKGCWSHPGSYLGELGLKTRAGDRVHIKTGSAKQGFKAIEINGKAMEVGESIVLADNMGSVSMNSTHVVSVNIGNWGFEFENSDHFVNQRAHVIDSRGLRAHGLLGQTWRETTYPNAIKYVQGEVEDYAVHDDDIFGDNFVFNNHN